MHPPVEQFRDRLTSSFTYPLHGWVLRTSANQDARHSLHRTFPPPIRHPRCRHPRGGVVSEDTGWKMTGSCMNLTHLSPRQPLPDDGFRWGVGQ